MVSWRVLSVAPKVRFSHVQEEQQESDDPCRMQYWQVRVSWHLFKSCCIVLAVVCRGVCVLASDSSLHKTTGNNCFGLFGLFGPCVALLACKGVSVSSATQLFFSSTRICAMAWRFDVADVNPLRWPRAVVTSIQRNTLDTTEGVWIGRSGDVGLTFVAPFDVAHWAVSTNGDIHEIGVEGPGLSGSGTTRSGGAHSSGTGGTWKVFTKDRIEGRQGQELQWTRLCGNPPVIRTRVELLVFARGGGSVVWTY